MQAPLGRSLTPRTRSLLFARGKPKRGPESSLEARGGRAARGLLRAPSCAQPRRSSRPTRPFGRAMPRDPALRPVTVCGTETPNPYPRYARRPGRKSPAMPASPSMPVLPVRSPPRSRGGGCWVGRSREPETASILGRAVRCAGAEPARWQRTKEGRCAAPKVPMKGRAGARLELVVKRLANKRHLPVIEMRRAV